MLTETKINRNVKKKKKIEWSWQLHSSLSPPGGDREHAGKKLPPKGSDLPASSRPGWGGAGQAGGSDPARRSRFPSVGPREVVLCEIQEVPPFWTGSRAQALMGAVVCLGPSADLRGHPVAKRGNRTPGSLPRGDGSGTRTPAAVPDERCGRVGGVPGLTAVQVQVRRSRLYL